MNTTYRLLLSRLMVVYSQLSKTHLWWAADGLRHEPSFYSADDSLVPSQYQGNSCGLMICYDGDFPGMTRADANLGCAIVF